MEDKIGYTENVVEIEGGNHAQFGNYGPQKGDLPATISAEEQQAQAVDAITDSSPSGAAPPRRGQLPERRILYASGSWSDLQSKRLPHGAVLFWGLHHAAVPLVPVESDGFAGAVGPFPDADLQTVGPAAPKTAVDRHIDGISVAVRPTDIALKFRPRRPEDAGLYLLSEGSDPPQSYPKYGGQKADDSPDRDENIPCGGTDGRTTAAKPVATVSAESTKT